MIILSNYHICEQFDGNLEELGTSVTFFITFYDYVPDSNDADHRPQTTTQLGMVECERYVRPLFGVKYELISV